MRDPNDDPDVTSGPTDGATKEKKTSRPQDAAAPLRQAMGSMADPASKDRP